MEIRMVLEPEAASYVKAMTKARGCTTGAAINRLIIEVIKQGGITITDHVVPVSDDEPQL